MVTEAQDVCLLPALRCTATGPLTGLNRPDDMRQPNAAQRPDMWRFACTFHGLPAMQPPAALTTDASGGS